jgi:hypothetical protein
MYGRPRVDAALRRRSQVVRDRIFVVDAMLSRRPQYLVTFRHPVACRQDTDSFTGQDLRHIRETGFTRSQRAPRDERREVAPIGMERINSEREHICEVGKEDIDRAPP